MGKITGFDVPVYDVERAAEFYQELFGWISTSHDAYRSNIAAVKTDEGLGPKENGAVNCGLYKRGNDKEMPAAVVTVDSIDKTLEKAAKLKGKVVTPKNGSVENGWWAEIQDTEGNIIRLRENNV